MAAAAIFVHGSCCNICSWQLLQYLLPAAAAHGLSVFRVFAERSNSS